jgi:hypothetical protein
VEKIGGINLQGHFNGRYQFGKLGFETLLSNFEASKGIFLGQNFPNNILDLVSLLYTSIPFQWFKNRINISVITLNCTRYAYLTSCHLMLHLFARPLLKQLLKTPFLKAYTPYSTTACLYMLADPLQPAYT